MMDRRYVAAFAAVTLLVAAALLVPRPSQPEDALESTAAVGPIASAIDEGAQTSLAGLLPTSEAYQRAMSAVNGLKNAIPSSAPSLTPSQLSDVKAIARGATAGAIISPSTITTPEERARLAAFAKGYLWGALDEIEAAPSAARAEVDEATARGAFTGVTAILLGEPIIPTGTYEAYAQALSDHLFAELATESATLAGLAGSPALIDVATMAATMVQNQIESIPNGAPASQVEAIATFGAGGIDGMIVGMVTSFPGGLPAPDREQLRAYFDGLTTGPDGVAPWTVPDADTYGALLVEYARTLPEAAFDAVKEASEVTMEDKLHQIRGIARGLAENAPERVAAILATPSHVPAIKQDVHDYLYAVAKPSLDATLGRTQLPSDPAAISAYMKGLTGGIEDLKGDMADSSGLSEAYLEGLTGAIKNFPIDIAPGNAEMLTGYAEGATNRITERMNAIQEMSGALVTDDDVALVSAMAAGLAGGAGPLAVTEHIVSGTVLERLSDAMIRGVVMDHQLAEAFVITDVLGEEIGVLFSIPAEAVPKAVDLALHSDEEREQMAAALGEVWGETPGQWAFDRAHLAHTQAFAVARDAVWIKETGLIVADAYLDTIEPDVDPHPEPDDISQAAKDYTNDIWAAAYLEPMDVLTGLAAVNYAAHAQNFATLASLPLQWLGGAPTQGEIDAADEVLGATVTAASDVTRFTDSEYMAIISDLHVEGIVEGIVGDDDPTAIDPTEPGFVDAYLPSWTKGVLDAIWGAPIESLRGDLTARKQWIATSIRVIDNVEPVGGEITDDQRETTKTFAEEVTAWALDGEDHIPHPGDLEKPLIPFAEASIRTGLAALPPVLAPEEQDAAVSYLFGIVRAVDDLPPYAFTDMTALDTVAMGAYVKGIANGVVPMIDDLHAYLCTQKVKPDDCPGPPPPPAPQCGDGKDNDGDGQIDFGSDLDCTTPNDDSESPPPPPQCRDGNDNDNDGKIDFGRAASNDPDCESADDTTEHPEDCEQSCMIQGYVENVGIWAYEITGSNILTYDHTEPTTTGLALITLWAKDVLGGHGLCPDIDASSVECHEGSTPPVENFAFQRKEQIEAFAELAGGPFEHLVDGELPLETEGALETLSGPLMSWLRGIKAAEFDLFDNGALIVLPSDDPEADFPDPTQEGFIDDMEAWSSALYRPMDTIGEVLTFQQPRSPFADALAEDFMYLFGIAFTNGGAAARDTLDASGEVGAGLTGMQQAALEAYAEALVAAATADVIAPAMDDADALLWWYAGLAEGGAEAIMDTDFEGTVDAQAASIVNYANYLATEYEPPQPDVAQILAGPPTNEPRPGTGGGSGGGNGGGGSGGGNGQLQYLKNLQAHAVGLARHVTNGPHQPGSDASFQYLNAIIDAAADLPSVTPRGPEDYAEILADWTAQEAAGALALVPSSPPTQQDVDARKNATVAYVGGFAGASPWALPADVERNALWAKQAIIAGGRILCPSETTPDECSALGEAIGSALGQSLPDEPDLDTVPDPLLLPGIVEGVIAGLQPDNDPDPEPEPQPEPTPWSPAEIGPIVQGLVDGLVPEGAGDDDVARISEIVTRAILHAEGQVPPDLAAALAEIIATNLLNADPSDMERLANGAVAAALATVGDATTDPDPGTGKRAAEEFMKPTEGGTSLTITVSDGARTYGANKLGGNEALDALQPLKFAVHVSSSSPVRSEWDLVWGTSADLAANGARRKLTEDAQGVLLASLLPAELASLPRGAKIHFLVQQTDAGQVRVHQNGARAFAFIPDRDVPTASLAPIAAPNGASFDVAWSGTDGDTRVASYRVEVRDGEGAWREWIHATADTKATFSGTGGHVYTFRVLAIDPVGHESPTTATASATVPPSAPANGAPTISFLAPTASSVFGRSISVDLAASDPDGTQPVIRVCVRKAGATANLACPIEGKATQATIDTASLADGKYVLQATATDGTLSTSAMSPTFRIDRAPPAFRGAVADATKERVLLTASIDGEAARVVADAGGRTLAMADDGKGVDIRAKDGIWSVATTLTPGEHAITFRAADATGNEATLARKLVVPATSPTGTSTGSTGPGGSRTGTSTTGTGTSGGNGGTTGTGGSDTTAPSAAAPAGSEDESRSGIPFPPAGLLLAALAAVALALRRRR